MRDDPLDVDFVARTLQQQTSSRMAENVEITVVHCADYALRLCFLSKSEAGMNRADCVIEFSQ